VTRKHWDGLVLKPERGYSGKGVRVGGVHGNVEEAIGIALSAGDYIVQEKIPLPLWGEDNPFVDRERQEATLVRFQTDFRCLFGPQQVFGFLVRYGGVPTNVGSGGGVQPLAILRQEMTVREAVDRINEAILSIDYAISSRSCRCRKRWPSTTSSPIFSARSGWLCARE
jgi:hypothetical protein